MTFNNLLTRSCVVTAIAWLGACAPSTDESTDSADPTEADGTVGSTTEASTTQASTTAGPGDPKLDSSSTGSESGGSLPEVCTCAEPSVSACAGSICSLASATCDYECPDENDYEVDDTEALDCVLTALRDRTAGVVSWSWNEGGGYATEQINVAILDDGTALIDGSASEDLAECELATRHVELRPDSHFDACLAEEDPSSRFLCLRQAVDRTLFTCREEACYEAE